MTKSAIIGGLIYSTSAVEEKIVCVVAADIEVGGAEYVGPKQHLAKTFSQFRG